MMFFGSYFQKLTGKGRLLLPKKMRSFINGDAVVLAKGFEACILGYPLDRWEASTKPYLDQAIANRQGRELRRYLFSSADVSKLDAQGRFVAPDHLLAYAQITDEVIVVGAGDHFEIWSKSAWEAHQKALETDNKFDDIAL